MRDCKGRFAPTPSGDMHIGNAFCYFLAWLAARKEGGKLVLRFEDCVWKLIEERNGEDLADAEIPPFLMKIAAFMQDKTRWEGTATELLEAVGETEVKPTSVTHALGEYYYELLQPQGIGYDTRRTGQSRLICLTRCDSDDGCDANDAYDDECEEETCV